MKCPFRVGCNHYQKGLLILGGIERDWKTANEIQVRIGLNLGYVYKVLRKLARLGIVDKRNRIVPLPSKSKFIGTNVKKVSEFKMKMRW